MSVSSSFLTFLVSSQSSSRCRAIDKDVTVRLCITAVKIFVKSLSLSYSMKFVSSFRQKKRRNAHLYLQKKNMLDCSDHAVLSLLERVLKSFSTTSDEPTTNDNYRAYDCPVRIRAHITPGCGSKKRILLEDKKEVIAGRKRDTCPCECEPTPTIISSHKSESLRFRLSSSSFFPNDMTDLTI